MEKLRTLIALGSGADFDVTGGHPFLSIHFNVRSQLAHGHERYPLFSQGHERPQLFVQVALFNNVTILINKKIS